MEVHVSSARKRSRGPRLTRVRGSRRASSVISSDDVRGFYVLLRNSFKRKKNEVIVLSLIIRLFTCVILLGVAVCKAVRCGSKRVNAAPLLNQEGHHLTTLSIDVGNKHVKTQFIHFNYYNLKFYKLYRDLRLYLRL